MEYYNSNKEQNHVVASTWKDPEAIKLSEVNQKRLDTE